MERYRRGIGEVSERYRFSMMETSYENGAFNSLTLEIWQFWRAPVGTPAICLWAATSEKPQCSQIASAMISGGWAIPVRVAIFARGLLISKQKRPVLNSWQNVKWFQNVKMHIYQDHWTSASRVCNRLLLTSKVPTAQYFCILAAQFVLAQLHLFFS